MKCDSHRLWYLASPYSKASSLHSACRQVSICAGRLEQMGYEVFCPIAHAHTISQHANIDPLDHKFWMARNKPFMDVCDALLICMLDGWKRSDGIWQERIAFAAAGKPEYFLNPHNMRISKRERDDVRPA
jgi:hypothetical protein